MENKKTHYFDDPKNVRLLLRIFYTVCALLVVADILYHRHSVHLLEKILAFYPLYGFIACVALVLIATQLRKILMRDEDYYDDK